MVTTSRRCGFRVVLVALTALLGACSNDDRDVVSQYGDNGKNSGREAATVEMTSSHAFSPREVTIRAGEAVVWKNASKDVHTVTADPSRVNRKESVSLPPGAKPFHSGEIAAGNSYRHTFTTPGTYKVVCLMHEEHGMTGTVTVKSADAGAPAPY